MKSVVQRYLYAFLAVCCVLWTFCIQAEAAPALRGTFSVKQADGTLLTIEQFGDEYHHWTATPDGVIVIPTAHGYFLAQIDHAGQLSASSTLAHEAGQRGPEEQALIKRQEMRHDLFYEQGIQASRRAPSITNTKYVPHTGSPRILTILATFQNVPFTINEPARAFDQYLNADTLIDLGNDNNLQSASIRKYFETSSHGQFQPRFDVVGPVMLPQDMEYYGGNSNTGSDDNYTEFFRDAIEQTKDMVNNWKIYDNDGDGAIDLVCIIFAGFGQNQGGNSNTLWARSSALNLDINDTLRISNFNCFSELLHPHYPSKINGSGVLIHEFSHCMGLPDLYATISNAHINNQSMETWSVMDYGLYNHNGYAPCPYTAWEQESMGWTKIEDVTELMTDGKCLIDNVLPLEEGGKAYKMVNSANDCDYIIMENIQKKGLNSYAYGHGLLVYHVDYPHTSINVNDHPNNVPGHPSVAIVPAGGILINHYLRKGQYEEWEASLAAAPFPGTNEVTRLTDLQQLPNYCFYSNDAIPTGMMLTNIIEDDESGAVSFYVTAEGTTDINHHAKGNTVETREPYYDLQGRKVAHLQKGMYIVQTADKRMKHILINN